VPRNLRITRAVRAGIATDTHHHAVVPPIHLSSTFAFQGFDTKGRYDYTRSGNPTRDILAETIADLEGGSTGIVTSSGMSAVALVLQLLKPGDLIVATHDCYGGTHRLLSALARRGLFEVAFIDFSIEREKRTESSDGGGDSLFASLFSLSPRLVWLETPSNPLLRITDIAAVSARAHAVGALVVVDNTFLSPGWQRPIEHGADIVVHSTTKYLNGHSDVVGGAVVARDAALGEALAWWANCLGIAGAPFDAFLTMRGIRTLAARLRVHEQNAEAVAAALATHDAVRQVWYPGLPGHPGHAVARRQQDGYGAMVSFELLGGLPAVEAFLDGLECFTLAESLGGVESLVAHPATMTHASMDEAAREQAGISDSLLRLSVGIEVVEDLVEDLTRGLERAGAPPRAAPGMDSGSVRETRCVAPTVD
jgi:cystathionine gamma-synthase